MRLKPIQIKWICQKILSTLRTKQLMTLKKNETVILARMEEIFIRDLKVEDDINREAEKLLETYAEKASGTIDRQQMFQMIKKQLIKDKKVIL